jgi:hypothetical protein
MIRAIDLLDTRACRSKNASNVLRPFGISFSLSLSLSLSRSLSLSVDVVVVARVRGQHHEREVSAAAGVHVSVQHRNECIYPLLIPPAAFFHGID